MYAPDGNLDRSPTGPARDHLRGGPKLVHNSRYRGVDLSHSSQRIHTWGKLRQTLHGLVLQKFFNDHLLMKGYEPVCGTEAQAPG